MAGLDTDDLTDVDRDILDLLKEGRETTGSLVDELGYHRNHVTNRLQWLHKGWGAVDYYHERTALWEIIFDPRDEDSG
jgi:hypothetical protein